MNYNFDPNKVPDDGGGSYELVPAGWYPAVIVDSEGKDTSSGGHTISMRWDITGPQHSGRVIWGRENFAAPPNASEGWQKAVEIGHRNLKRLCEAVGMPGFRHPREFVGRRCLIKVGIEPARNGYEARNKVAGYKAQEVPGVPGGAPPQGFDDDLPF